MKLKVFVPLDSFIGTVTNSSSATYSVSSKVALSSLADVIIDMVDVDKFKFNLVNHLIRVEYNWNLKEYDEKHHAGMMQYYLSEELDGALENLLMLIPLYHILDCLNDDDDLRDIPGEILVRAYGQNIATDDDEECFKIWIRALVNELAKSGGSYESYTSMTGYFDPVYTPFATLVATVPQLDDFIKVGEDEDY